MTEKHMNVYVKEEGQLLTFIYVEGESGPEIISVGYINDIQIDIEDLEGMGRKDELETALIEHLNQK